MATHNNYYPTRRGDQIIWLTNFRSKMPNYQAPLNYTAGEITDIQADCDFMGYLYDTFGNAAHEFADAVTTYVREAGNGNGPKVVALPVFELPATPPPPAAVKPGAINRIFAFVKNMKTRPDYTTAIGEDLGVVGSETRDRPAVPEPTGEVRGSEVVLSFTKQRHLGVWIEGQINEETEWQFLAIDTTNPYNDTRPLKVPGKPETRRYRMCFWDGEPTNEWSNVVTVTFGG